MAKKPMWVTPERQQHLLRLWQEYGNQCLLGHRVCPEMSHYLKPRQRSIAYGNSSVVFTEYQVKRLIDVVWAETVHYWTIDDRSQREYAWKLEQRELHRTGEIGKFKRRFDPVERDVFSQQQPSYYMLGLGMDGVTHRQIAIVRVAGTYVHLHVDVSSAVVTLAKSKRRRLVRRGGQPPVEVQKAIESLCFEAVQDYMKC